MPCAMQKLAMEKTAVGGPRIRGLVTVSLVEGVADVATASVFGAFASVAVSVDVVSAGAIAAVVTVSGALIFGLDRCGGLLRRNVFAVVRALRPETSGRAIAGPHWARWRAVCDPPPLKWSDLRYVFDIQEDCNGKE